MQKQNEITYKNCGIDNVNEFYKEKFAHNHTYDINDKPYYAYDILNLKQMYIFDYIKPNTKVLDFGCGSGIFKILKQLNCELVGLDLSKKATDIAKNLNSYDEVYNLDIFDSLLNKYLGYFDYVISSDVFGHIEFKNKDNIIQRLKQFLKPNGVMIHGIETGDIKYNEMSKEQRYDFVSVDGHVGMESEEKTTKRFQKYFDYVNIYTPYGIVNDLDEIIKQHKSYDVKYLEGELIDYLIEKKDDKRFKDAFNLSQFCTHKAYENFTNINNFLNLYGFSFVIASDFEINKINSEKPIYKKKSKEKEVEKTKKIVIVAPSPIPFTVGGAEKLWWGILEYINKHTNHQCELIKIPIKEDSFWNLIDSYKKFYDLDLSYFDIVISTKYPAWMVQHENHHIYLQHCLRGLYDTYHFTSLPKEIKTNNIKIKNFLNILDNESSSIEEIFTNLYLLKNETNLPKDIFDFPGAFIRKIIHTLDSKTMKNVKSFSAISNTIINRKEYFPENQYVNKIYHPSNLTEFQSKKYEYFFTVSRLDNAKRVNMIVEAYMKSDTNIPLKIAGIGPEEKRLKDICKNDSRIEFLGFVSDDELLEYYSNAFAVIFIPYDEDYGLITIESFMSKKPVITFTDTGGVCEFVEHNQTGLLSKPSEELLTKNIDYLSSNPQLASSMGKNAYEKVKNITWESTVSSLLLNTKNQIKPKITVLNTYPVYPPRGGGQNRIFYLYKEIAKYVTVEMICLSNENDTYSKEMIAPNFYEIRIPKSYEFSKKERELSSKLKISVTDIAMILYYDSLSQYICEIKKSAENSKLIVSSHPYCYPIIEKYLPNKRFIYESHNLEYILKKQMIEDNKYNRDILNELFKVEKDVYKNSLFTTFCSKDDKKLFAQIFDYNHSNSLVVANGVDLDSVYFSNEENRNLTKKSLNIQDSKIVLFIGSWHKPNIDAVYEIFEIAKKLENYQFIIIGNIDNFFKSKSKPSNVGFTGMINDTEKQIYLSISDIAINPMLTGSGTNLKMLDYMAAGIPIISTKIGARGLNIPDDCLVISDINNFHNLIVNIANKIDINKAKEFVENNYSWKVIYKDYKNKIMEFNE